MKTALIILAVVTVIALAAGITGVVIAGKALQANAQNGIAAGGWQAGIARGMDRTNYGPGGMMDRGGMMGGYDTRFAGRGGMMGGVDRRAVGRGGMMARGGTGLLHDAVVAAFAEKVGLTVEDVTTKLDAGETLASIAIAQGTAEADVPQLLTDVHTTALAAAVADGTITQAQADAMQQRWEARGGFGANCPGLVIPTETPAN